MGDTKSILKLAAIGAGLYLLYEWLQSSGLWAEYFGGTSFATPATLMTYCQANPSGSATYTGGSTPATATCAQWVAANSSPAPTPTTTGTPIATVAPTAGSTLIPRLQAAAIAASGLGTDSATVSQWNYLLQQDYPNAPVITVTTAAGQNAIPAAQYVGYYLALNFPDPTLATPGVSGYEENPYRWAN